MATETMDDRARPQVAADASEAVDVAFDNFHDWQREDGRREAEEVQYGPHIVWLDRDPVSAGFEPGGGWFANCRTCDVCIPRDSSTTEEGVRLLLADHLRQKVAGRGDGLTLHDRLASIPTRDLEELARHHRILESELKEIRRTMLDVIALAGRIPDTLTVDQVGKDYAHGNLQAKTLERACNVRDRIEELYSTWIEADAARILSEVTGVDPKE